jgi:tetratricopeptide (TPR) repeat protein
MFRRWLLFPSLLLLFSRFAAPQETHDHGAPEKLGTVNFSTSCKSEVQAEFNRAVALLHSFAYSTAKNAFRDVSARDPQCAMAHWGIAMSQFYQLWDPPLTPASSSLASKEIRQAIALDAGSERERQFIHAAASIFQDPAATPYAARAQNYERAMATLAASNRQDVEAQVFYALALLANASPADKSHQRQKQAADLLEPLYRAYPQHPGIAHYLIHACDNAEMAQRGLPAAKDYAQIAPSAPHALHMPSHIFTRLGLWDDSIASNIAAREAAHRTGDLGEELHAMDYLVYAYLQSGRDTDAAEVIQQLKTMPALNTREFKVGYAATVMPVRYLIERQQWTEASRIVPPSQAPPHVIAIAVWGRGMGLARSGHAAEARAQIDPLQRIEDQLQSADNLYWATQTRVMKRELAAWSAQAEKKTEEAVSLLRQAAEEEDSLEKLPVTPGPIVPAREQLGQLLLAQARPDLAAKEFQTALASSPGRRGALEGASNAAKRMQESVANRSQASTRH